MTALSPSYFPTNEDMEEFASEYLGLSGCDADMFYESYYKMNDNDSMDEYLEEDEYRDEVTQNWTY